MVPISKANDIDENKYISLKIRFKDIDIESIYSGGHIFKSRKELINTIEAFFQYDTRLYEELLSFFINKAVTTLICSHSVLKNISTPIKKIINDIVGEGLYYYIFEGKQDKLLTPVTLLYHT
jgi:hypothetical protein